MKLPPPYHPISHEPPAFSEEKTPPVDLSLSAENILGRTQGGLEIYRFILCHYYPEDEIFLRHENYQLARNPFNGNKRSLAIKMRMGRAHHHDLERLNFSGDALAFAMVHFHFASPEQVYRELNKRLHLELEPSQEGLQEWLDAEDDSWRPLVSYFAPPIQNIHPSASMSLATVHELLTGPFLSESTQRLRQLSSAKERRAYKAAKLPYVTFAGCFQQRGDKHLLQASNLMVLDLDELDDVEAAKQALLGIGLLETELLFVSPSGRGIKWVVRTDGIHDEYSEAFQALSDYLMRNLGLEVDQSGKDISRASFLCHDEHAVLHWRHKEELKMKPL